MKEAQKQQASSDGRLTESGWFALVDTEFNHIIRVDICNESVREFLKDAILPGDADDWLDKNPDYNGKYPPADVMKKIADKYIIAECRVEIPADAKAYIS